MENQEACSRLGLTPTRFTDPPYVFLSRNINYLFFQDGGCTCPGDVAKAFGAGADFVMLGGMLAGHDQSGGEVRHKPDGTKVKLFYGMSSDTAMKKHAGGMAEYRLVTVVCRVGVIELI